tara:strand:- start:32 stop:334 length:303 start_codon:yes stop_codon:yes gene_type:complete
VDRNKLKEFIKTVLDEIHSLEDEELEEITTTGDIDGYSTPNWGRGKKGKKKSKNISTNSTGYKVVKESLDKKDLETIRVLIRNVIVDVIRDIWIKRGAWK